MTKILVFEYSCLNIKLPKEFRIDVTFSKPGFENKIYWKDSSKNSKSSFRFSFDYFCVINKKKVFIEIISNCHYDQLLW